MKLKIIFIAGTMLMLAFPVTGSWADTNPLAPDNSGINVRDAEGNTATPEKQSETESDRKLTQIIRRAITADSALSVNAKNVKIITIGGQVTLRGPVQNVHERASIAAKAEQVAGPNKVTNLIEVIPTKDSSDSKSKNKMGE